MRVRSFVGGLAIAAFVTAASFVAPSPSFAGAGGDGVEDPGLSYFYYFDDFPSSNPYMTPYTAIYGY
jgi:hypothetical protein